jgi:peptide/nickel transport system substrate-binding protein
VNLRKIMRAAITIVASSALIASGAVAPANAAKQTTLTLASLINVNSWDPSQADIGHGIVFYQGVYDNLILRAPNGTFKPNLATKWTVNKAATEVSLDLRKGVVFSDGSKFDATVAKKNLDHFISANGPQAANMAGAKVAVVDADTIKITLATPNPDIVYYLATTNSFMAASSAVGTTGIKTKPVGSGPYLYDSSSVPGSQVVFVANPKYWDKSKVKFQKIVLKIMPDVTARLNAIMSGQVDGALLDVKTSSTAKSRGLKLNQYNTDWQGLFLFDRAGKINKALKDVRVRQAIAYSIDRAALLKSIQAGYGELTTQIFSKASGAYDASLDKMYAYNPTKAKQLLASAGYANGFTLTMPAWPDAAMRAALSDYLKAVGINLVWDNVPAVEYRNAFLSGKYEAGLFQLFQGTAWVNFNLAIAPEGPRNIFKSTTSLINNAYKNVLKDPSAGNVKQQMTTVNREVVKAAWFVPFFRLPQLYFTSKGVTVTPQAQNATPYLYNYAPSGK